MRHLFILTVIAIAINDISGHWYQSSPMVCFKTRGGHSFKLPAPAVCHSPLVTDKLPVEPQKRVLYRHNIKQYEFSATLCGCKTETVTVGNNWLGLNRYKVESIDQSYVTPDQCAIMSRDKKVLDVGKLVNVGTHWSTQNKLITEYPGIFSSEERIYRNTNCYLIQTTGWKRHGHPSIHPLKLSAQSDAQHCNYTSNNCELKNGEAVIWKSDIIEENQYVSWLNVTGNQIGSRWLSDDGTRLLTHSNSSVTDHDGTVYQMSYEGIPFVIDREYAFPILKSKWQQRVSPGDGFRAFRNSRNRTRRQTMNDGIVTAADAASKYSALSFEQTLNYDRTIRYSVQRACLSNQFAVEQLKAQMITDPIMAMRAYTKPAYTTAVFGGEHCVIYPCKPVPFNQLKWLPMPLDRCFSNMPMSVIFNEKNETLYMDPVTNILTHSAIEIQCSRDTSIPFSSNGTLYHYDKNSGNITIVHQFQELQLMRYEDDKLNAFILMGPVTFTDASMYSLKDVIGSDHRNDAMHFLQTKQQVWSDVAKMSKGSEGSKSAQDMMNYVTTAVNGLSIWNWMGLTDLAATLSHIGGILGVIYIPIMIAIYIIRKQTDSCLKRCTKN